MGVYAHIGVEDLNLFYPLLLGFLKLLHQVPQGIPDRGHIYDL